MSRSPDENNGGSTLQAIWGLVLAAAGIGVLLRIPEVMVKVREIQQFVGVTGFIRACFYIMAVILIGGGVKKVWRRLRGSG